MPQLLQRSSQILLEDITRAWDALIEDRLKRGYYANRSAQEKQMETSEHGPVLLAEALCSFLLPALNENLLPRLIGRLQEKPEFREAFFQDVKRLFDLVTPSESGEPYQFTGEPYSNLGAPMVLARGVKQVPRNLDCATWVVGTGLYVWQLFSPHQGKAKAVSTLEAGFFDDLCRTVDAAIDFMMSCYSSDQKGFRWTDDPAIPPLLYFTWTACKAFDDIDAIVLPLERRENIPEEADLLESRWLDDEKIKASPFNFDRYKLLECMRGAREGLLQWVEELEAGGMCEDNQMKLEGKDDVRYAYWDLGSADYAGQQIEHVEKVNWLNNLMVLDGLVTTYADKEPALGLTLRPRLERALVSVVEKYRDPSVRPMLDNWEYVFFLPIGESAQFNRAYLRQSRENRVALRYGDKVFVPLLLSIVVDLLEFGIGNPIILEELMRELYGNLIFGRNRRVEWQWVWDRDSFSIFATQRTLEALNDYQSYVSSREKSEMPGEAVPASIDRAIDNLSSSLKATISKMVTEATKAGVRVPPSLEGVQNKLRDLRAGLEELKEQQQYLVTRDKFTKLFDDVHKLGIKNDEILRELRKIDDRLKALEHS